MQQISYADATGDNSAHEFNKTYVLDVTYRNCTNQVTFSYI
jgi:hypothetical protein